MLNRGLGGGGEGKEWSLYDALLLGNLGVYSNVTLYISLYIQNYPNCYVFRSLVFEKNFIV